MFGSRRKNKVAVETTDAVLVYAPVAYREDDELAAVLLAGAGHFYLRFGMDDAPAPVEIRAARAIIALYPDPEDLARIAREVTAQRRACDDGIPVLVIVLAPGQLTDFGRWLADQAARDQLSGIRLLVDSDPLAGLRTATNMLAPMHGPNVVRMPMGRGKTQYVYCVSPESRDLLARLAALAKNNVDRVYLLGAPGTGKTSLAYYYYLARGGRGKFVALNLGAEVGDGKLDVKSLLCGHVAGAFPGAGSRQGAFELAGKGVCFLDGSHGTPGGTLEVLMDALDSGQYLPYGASVKRPLNCGVVMASNRTWKMLMRQADTDEHARLGTVPVHLAELAVRREDLIAILAATLARMADKSVTWVPPVGLTDAAWAVVRDCPWRGNARTLIRAVETAFVECAGAGGTVIEDYHVERAIALWEPGENSSYALYADATASASDMDETEG